MRIRTAEPEDFSELRRIYLESRRRYFHWTDRTKLAAGDFDAATRGERVWVAVDEAEKPVGFASVWMPEHFIHSLFVAPERTGLGLGAALLRHCLSNIGRPARLKCVQANAPAIRFYRSHGWQIVGEGKAADEPYFLMQFDDEV
jgi:GNAT superfamily N-acetyltransferase